MQARAGFWDFQDFPISHAYAFYRRLCPFRYTSCSSYIFLHLQPRPGLILLRGFGGSTRSGWYEVGRSAASRCRKPSSSFSCWGRQRRKVKSPDCRGKGLGGILHQKLVLITASTLLHCGDSFGSSCRIGAGRGFQLSRQASVLRRISP